MGCAFSSTTHIFVIDPGGGHRRDSAGGLARKLFWQVRQGFAHHHQRGSAKTTALSAAFWLAKTKGGNDVVVVGQLKSNGAYSRRRLSNEAKFIEHRARLSVTKSNICGDQAMARKNGKIEENAAKQLPEYNNRKTSEKASGGHGHYGLTDFQKRLERLKARRIEREEIVGEENERPGKGGKGMMAADGDGIQRREEANLRRKKTKTIVEPLIVKHLSAIEETEDHDVMDLMDGELWREWDELSAECCSIQIGPPQGGGGGSWHDGEVSEASFVLVKKRLKVAWEHCQLHQMRKLSQLRRESAAAAGERVAPPSQMDAKRNNWIPAITQVDE